MIDYIRGILTVKEIGHATVEAHGVGYAISIPLSTYERLPAPGTETVLQIHYHVREDDTRLFGFISSEEREIFRELIGVSKIGPKVALNVLSGVSLQDLVQSVNRGDPARLQKIPGVGAKTAQRLVMELRGKLGTAPMTGSRFTVPAPKSSDAQAEKLPVRDEVFTAMISLGYNEKQVLRALERIESEMNGEEPVEAWIRKALQVI
ncbi:MAG: Holliday junction branch migration protein RuvA [Chitinispirillaceae bacterium]|nr:Holliday junction branch migration protein RuvA [Chitinispirillaceae bacterium]